MESYKSNKGEARIDPWDPNTATLAVMRIRTVSVSVADDAHESVTYTMPDIRARMQARLKNLA